MLSSTESLIFLIWLCMHSFCSFRYTLVNSFCAFSSFWVSILVRFHLMRREAIFTSARFFLTANVSHGTLGLALYLVGMHSATASKWALTKFSYSSFEVGVSDISRSALNLFLSVNIYLSLISLLSRDQSYYIDELCRLNLWFSFLPISCFHQWYERCFGMLRTREDSSL